MIRRAQPWLGTMVEITVADAALAPDDAQQAVTQAFAQVALVHRLMSFHDSASDVARLNLAWASDTLAVHPHTWQVLHLAQQVADQSDGIFNIACAPRLVDWECLPAPQADLPAYRPGVTVLRCEANNMVRKAAPGWVDLGGIAKGYAVDLAIEALCAAGVTSACVNAGGDLRAIGDAPWPVTIRDPRALARAGARITIRNEALATSANYFTARQHAGRTISALVDGRDGMPITDGASVSVRAASCAVADALTKVVLASGDREHPALRAMNATALII
ncbi:FAD:protein FMN transferase [Duganella sp. LX20W]|uniref:FAD:protein FMN transferase n=1 Tax=Rugamonas brunnea TaxID=2758569 RepID=A0A7W2EVZ6_9BURK|nr:FAD:protein FMN transferase [Rugamonas brunnea]MBA5639590.1 FAD:protein FMN transferase [Rugamonas brunnea]